MSTTTNISQSKHKAIGFATARSAIATTCGNCPHATPSRISKVLFTCSLWGGVVKESDLACGSVGGAK